MIDAKHLSAVLAALPDPAFLISRSGKYIDIFGGKDTRYYHDGSGLIGLNIADVVKPEKANWFLSTISHALETKALLIKEYELSNKDVKSLPDEGPSQPIWFEARVQALDFKIDGEDVVLWVASNISERHQLELKLMEQSDTDQLTGLYNRRRLERELNNQFSAFKRHHVDVSLFMFDLDHLKAINDSAGHQTGDQAIITVAQLCRSALRQTDIPCRFGGDEFIVVLPHITIEQAKHTAERLRAEAQTALALLNLTSLDVTLGVSVGVTAINKADRHYEQVLQRADNALYKAKRAGRNQVVVDELRH